MSLIKTSEPLVNNKKQIWVILGLILILGCSLRIWGINFGLPYRYHIDETQIIPPAARLCSGDYHMPSNNGGPNLQHIVLCGGDLIVFGFGFITNNWRTPYEFAQAYEQDPTSVFLVARLIHATLGIATIIIVYYLGKSLWNKSIGIVAAGLISIVFLHVRESHFASRDLFASFFIIVSMLFASRVIRTRGLRDGLGAGLFIGFATGVMWTAGISFLSVISAHIFAFSKSREGPGLLSPLSLKNGSASIFGAVLGFLIGYPNLILRPYVALEYLMTLIEYSSEGELSEFLYDTVPGWIYYIKTLWWGVGPILLLLLLIALIYAIIKHTPKDIILLAFVIPYILIISGTSNYIGRYLILILPILLVLCARLLVEAYTNYSLRFGKNLIVFSSLAILIILPTLTSSIRFDYLLTKTDTRTLAKDWIERNVPSGELIAMDWPIHGPPISSYEEPQPRSQKKFQVEILGDIGLAELTLNDYRKRGFDYLITSSNISNMILSDPVREEKRKTFYRRLIEEGRNVAEFTPYSGNKELGFVFDEIYGPAVSLWQRERPGPTLVIYQLDDKDSPTE